MNVVEILEAARRKIEKPEQWTRGAYARNANGHVVITDSSSVAVCWCAVGAIRAVTDSYSSAVTDGYSSAYDALLSSCGTYDIVSFNGAEGTTHDDVLAAFDRAITAAKAATP